MSLSDGCATPGNQTPGTAQDYLKEHKKAGDDKAFDAAGEKRHVCKRDAARSISAPAASKRRPLTAIESGGSGKLLWSKKGYIGPAQLRQKMILHLSKKDGPGGLDAGDIKDWLKCLEEPLQADYSALGEENVVPRPDFENIDRKEQSKEVTPPGECKPDAQAKEQIALKPGYVGVDKRKLLLEPAVPVIQDKDPVGVLESAAVGATRGEDTEPPAQFAGLVQACDSKAPSAAEPSIQEVDAGAATSMLMIAHTDPATPQSDCTAAAGVPPDGNVDPKPVFGQQGEKPQDQLAIPSVDFGALEFPPIKAKKDALFAAAPDLLTDDRCSPNCEMQALFHEITKPPKLLRRPKSYDEEQQRLEMTLAGGRQGTKRKALPTTESPGTPSKRHAFRQQQRSLVNLPQAVPVGAESAMCSVVPLAWPAPPLVRCSCAL